MWNKLILVPGASFRRRGISIPSIAECDVADIIMRTMSETLEEFAVAHERVWDDEFEPGAGDLALEIGVGYHTTKRTTNESVVQWGTGAQETAERIAETLSEWGRCASFGHKTKIRDGYKPSRIRIATFAINGTDAEQYLCRLTALGRELAQSIADLTRDLRSRSVLAQATERGWPEALER